jgi:hypothetical protein
MPPSKQPSTKAPAKRWVLVHNNYSLSDYDELLKFCTLYCEYAIVAREVSATQTPHIQAYLCLKEKKRMSTIKSLYSNSVHLEKAVGTSAQNRMYCMKDGDFWEYGTIPRYASGDAKITMHEVAGSFIDCMDSRSSLRSFMETNPGQWMLHGRTFVNNYLLSIDEVDRPFINVIWIWGPTGVGKSHFANEMMPKAYRKAPNTKWWHRYRLQKDVIVDELNADAVDISYWLVWFDKYKISVETKGGEIPLHADQFIVTSNYPPQSIFSNNIEALLRRITVFEIKQRSDLEEIRYYIQLNKDMRQIVQSAENDVESETDQTEVYQTSDFGSTEIIDVQELMSTLD